MNTILKRLKKMFLVGTTLLLILLLIILGSNWIVKNKSSDKIYSSVNEIPSNRVGLLLGTKKYLKSNFVNLYYQYRIDAAYELFKAKKIDYILISGDNGRKGYDEPTDMRDDLIALGVPEGKIFLDYAGFRTLDSIVRCKEIFDQNEITVISQQFHNERAIFIAEQKGIDAIGFNAKDVSARYGFKTKQREKLARVKMIIDLIVGKKPKFLGEKIEIK